MRKSGTIKETQKKALLRKMYEEEPGCANDDLPSYLTRRRSDSKTATYRPRL